MNYLSSQFRQIKWKHLLFVKKSRMKIWNWIIFRNWLNLNGIRFGLVSNKLIKVFLSDSETGDRFKNSPGRLPFTADR